MSGCLELSHRYVFCCYPNSNKQIYTYCTLSWSTKSMQYLPRGFMSFKMRAIIISIPLDSWVAMHVCKIREEEGMGQGRERGRGGEGKEGDDTARGRERIWTSANFQKKEPELKIPCSTNNLSAKAEQPENTPQEVLGEICVYRTNPNTASSEIPNWKKGGAS